MVVLLLVLVIIRAVVAVALEQQERTQLDLPAVMAVMELHQALQAQA
jgi:hypothetical protein